MEGIVVDGQTDIGLAIGPQQVQGEATQPGEDAGALADAAGILPQGHVLDVVHLVLNAPVTTNRLGQNLRRSEPATEVIAPFPRGLPVPGFGREGIGEPLNLDHGFDVLRPWGWQAGRGKHAHRALGVPAAVEVHSGGALQRLGRLRQGDHGLAQPRLIVLDLYQQVVAAGSGRFKGFF